MSDNSCRYNCTFCNKQYASSNSLWNHNKKFHNENKIITSILPQNPQFTTQTTSILPQKLFCKYCSKNISRKDNLFRHEKICKNKETKITEMIELKDKIKELENKIDIKSSKIINSNNNINNGIVNNTFIINKVGEESISKLKFNDIKNIFREQKNCLYHAIKYVNFNEKIPENHSFYNSSLEGKYINVFNNYNNEIEKKNICSQSNLLCKLDYERLWYQNIKSKILYTIRKKDFFDTILLSSINIMNMFYNKIKDDLSKKKQLKLINMMDDIKNIAHLDNSKKIYITNFNEISYNNKKIIKKTWNKKLNDLEISENNSSSDEDSDSSKDSFCYVTDNEE